MEANGLLSIKQIEELTKKLDLIGEKYVIHNEKLPYIYRESSFNSETSDYEDTEMELVSYYMYTYDSDYNLTIYIPYETEVLDFKKADSTILEAGKACHVYRKDRADRIDNSRLCNILRWLDKPIRKLTVIGGEGLLTCREMFSHLDVASIDINAFRPIKAKDFSDLFFNSNINNGIIGVLELPNALCIDRMFRCTVTQRFNVIVHAPKAIRAYSLFCGCDVDKISFIDWDLSSIDSMRCWFNLSKIGILELDTIDTSKITYMSGLFVSATINNVNFSKFNISSAKLSIGMKTAMLFNNTVIGKDCKLESSDSKFNEYVSKYTEIVRYLDTESIYIMAKIK